MGQKLAPDSSPPLRPAPPPDPTLPQRVGLATNRHIQLSSPGTCFCPLAADRSFQEPPTLASVTTSSHVDSLPPSLSSLSAETSPYHGKMMPSIELHLTLALGSASAQTWAPSLPW